jgi:hypothetical protein
LITYQVADHDLALAGQASALSRSRLGCAAGGLGALLNATSRSRVGGLGAGRATLGATATLLGLPLAGEDLVEGLIELASHGDECVELVMRGFLEVAK